MIMAIEHSGIPITADSNKTKLIDMESTDLGEMERHSALAAKRWHKKKPRNGNTNNQTSKSSNTNQSRQKENNYLL